MNGWMVGWLVGWFAFLFYFDCLNLFSKGLSSRSFGTECVQKKEGKCFQTT